MALTQTRLQPDSGARVWDADMEENDAPSEATFKYTVQQFSKMKNRIVSPAFYARNLTWNISVEPTGKKDSTAQRYLGVFLYCNSDNDPSWTCYAGAELRLLSVRPNVKPFSRKLHGLFNSKNSNWGYQKFMAWNNILDPEKGYIKDDAITLEVYVVADVPHSVSSEVSSDMKIYTDDRIDQSLLNELKDIKEAVKIDSLDLSKVDSKGQLINVFNEWKNERIEKIQDEWKKLCIVEDMLNSQHFKGYADGSRFENLLKILALETNIRLAEKKQNEPNLYMTINVLLKNNLSSHQGYDLYDPDRPSFRIFKIKKMALVSQMMNMFAEAFKHETRQMRPWPFSKRPNGTMRPSLLDLEANSNKTVIEASKNQDSWTIFLELLSFDSGFVALPSFLKEEDCFLFFKMYDPKHKKICHYEHGYFMLERNIEHLIPFLNKRAEFPPDTKLVLYQEVGPNDVKKIINYSDSLEKAIEAVEGVRFGDIIVFEKEEQEELSDLPTCIDYFKDLYYRVEIIFVDKCTPNDPGFTMQLSQRMTYDQMVQAVAQRLGTDPTLLQFFKCPNSEDSPEQALSSTFEGTLRDHFQFSQTKTSTKIFYQHELEKKQFNCLYVGPNVFEEKELILYPNKRGTVSDLLEEAKKQIEFGEESTRQLKFTEVFFHKVALGPKEDTPLDQLVLKAPKVYRIEEVPGDEIHIEEDEMLISCAHFKKEVGHTFGSSFLFKIKHGESFIIVKKRIQKRLGVPDDEFEKYEFLIVAMGKQKVFIDEEYIINLADFKLLPHQAGFPKPWLGLDHMNEVPEMSI